MVWFWGERLVFGWDCVFWWFRFSVVLSFGWLVGIVLWVFWVIDFVGLRNIISRVFGIGFAGLVWVVCRSILDGLLCLVACWVY